MITNQEEFVDEQSFINRGKSTSMNKGVEGSSSRNNVSFIHFSSFYTNRISFAKFAAEKPQLLTSLTTIQLFVDLASHFKLCTIINRGKRVEIKFHILRTVVNQVSNDATV